MRNAKGKFVKGIEAHNKKWFGKCVISDCPREDLKAFGLCHKHHIDENKKNSLDSNLISLCKKCHAKVHFTTGDWKNYLTGILNGETL